MSSGIMPLGAKTDQLAHGWLPPGRPLSIGLDVWSLHPPDNIVGAVSWSTSRRVCVNRKLGRRLLDSDSGIGSNGHPDPLARRDFR
jgi:hypothetical protein